MGWKEWPAWVKGGIIADLIFIILGIILLPFSIDSFPYSVYLLLPGFYLLSFLKLISESSFLLSSENILKNLFLPMILSLITYFLIGAIIGFIISKIKSHNEVQYKNV